MLPRTNLANPWYIESMKAYPSPGPGNLSNDKISHSNADVKTRGHATGRTPQDSLFALRRRIEYRLTIIESKLSALRRDVDRVEKHYYRARERGDAAVQAAKAAHGNGDNGGFFRDGGLFTPGCE